MEIPLQQTQKWQKFQQDLGEQTIFKQTSDYTFLVIVKHTPLGTYLYTPYGPYTRTKTGLNKALDALQTLAKTKKAMFIRIEPQLPLAAEILRQTPNARKSHDLNPADTWTLDLTPDANTLYAAMKQNTRNLCRNFTKKGLAVTTSHNPADIKYLVNLQRPLAQAKKIATFDENYLKTELQQDFATLYLVHYTSEGTKRSRVIGASLFFDHAGTRYYMQSATDLTLGKLPATYALLNTAIFDAKAAGLKNFDFWGIAPDDAPSTHPWAGFTNFKKSFGGTAVHYAGTWDLVQHPAKYRLYLLLRQLNKLRRKIKKYK